MRDGTKLDFSGRHEACGYLNSKPIQQDFLKGQRNTDHRDVGMFYVGTDHPWDKMHRFMNECGAIRVMTTERAGKGTLKLEFTKNISIPQKTELKKQEGKPAIVDIDAEDGFAVCSEEFGAFTVKGLERAINGCAPKIRRHEESGGIPGVGISNAK